MTQKKIQHQGQGLMFPEQTLSKPRTGMVEIKAKNQQGQFFEHDFCKLWLENFHYF